MVLKPPQSPASSSVRVPGLLFSQAGPALSPSVAPTAPALARAHFDLSPQSTGAYRKIAAVLTFV
jgi:hypothetical protein